MKAKQAGTGGHLCVLQVFPICCTKCNQLSALCVVSAAVDMVTIVGHKMCPA